MKKESLQNNFYFSVLQHIKTNIFYKRLFYSPGSIQQRKKSRQKCQWKLKILFCAFLEHQSYIWFCWQCTVPAHYITHKARVNTETIVSIVNDQSSGVQEVSDMFTDWMYRDMMLEREPENLWDPEQKNWNQNIPF